MSDPALTPCSSSATLMLCEDDPVTSQVDLTLLAEHRRGHGALPDALNQGRIDADRLRKALAVRHSRRPPTNTRSWQSLSRRGCVRTRRPARTACSATSPTRTPCAASAAYVLPRTGHRS